MWIQPDTQETPRRLHLQLREPRRAGKAVQPAMLGTTIVLTNLYKLVSKQCLMTQVIAPCLKIKTFNGIKLANTANWNLETNELKMAKPLIYEAFPACLS